DLPLSLHTATRRQGKIRGVGDKTLRDASSRATKASYPALSLCDLIFSGVFERHPRLTLAIVEFELAWAPHLLSTMDYTYRERHGEAIHRFKNGMLPSDFFRRNVVLSFQEDAIGIRLRDAARHPRRHSARRPRPACKGGDPGLPRHQDRRRGAVDPKVSRLRMPCMGCNGPSKRRTSSPGFRYP